MKKITYVILTLVVISGCSEIGVIQVFDTSTTNTKLSTDGYWVFENDSVKLTYSFWAKKGLMSFSVYNKLDKPIYIDWKNSSFIVNSNKLDYWVDEQQSNLIGYYGGYYYNGPLIKPGFTVNEAVQATTSTTIKPERITFIPPKSFYYQSKFYLMQKDFFLINTHMAQKLEMHRNDNPKKMTTVWEQNFDYSKSPLKFRNYLAFSFAENSSNFFFIDNEFYLSSVREMDFIHYLGKSNTDENGNTEYSRPYRKYTSFYIKIDPMNSIQYGANY
jgi:hypothetical protein